MHQCIIDNKQEEVYIHILNFMSSKSKFIKL